MKTWKLEDARPDSDPGLAGWLRAELTRQFTDRILPVDVGEEPERRSRGGGGARVAVARRGEII